MHLVFERSEGRFKSNCNILTLAWTPYYAEDKFRHALFDYHQKNLAQLVEPDRLSDIHRDVNNESGRVGYLARGHNARLQRGLRRAASALAREDVSNLIRVDHGEINQLNQNQPTNQLSDKPGCNRIKEFCERSAYATRPIHCPKAHESSSSTNNNSDQNLRINPNRTIDYNYGRLEDFGWLIVGNIGKAVGITITSMVEPPSNPPEYDNSEAPDDLITFTDDNFNESYHRNEYDRIRPDLQSKRTNHNLRGHLGDVILVRWNEFYQKLATIDSKGNVLIWARSNDKFTVQTPFYNRTKTVADFRWSNDGKTALICYTDSFILVGSSTGQRHWHSMLNLEDYHITCATWTPNDENLLLGVSNGNIVVIDLARSELTEVLLDNTNIRSMCWSTSDLSLKTMESIKVAYKDSTRHRNGPQIPPRSQSASRSSNRINVQSNDSNLDQVQSRSSRRSKPIIEYEQDHKVRNILAIDFASNIIKLFESGISDPKPTLISIDLESYIMQWSSDGKILAVAGFNIHTSAPSVGCLKCHYSNKIKFFNQYGKLIYKIMLRHSRYPITAFTWAHGDQRIFVATGPHIHCAKVFYGIPSLELLATSCLQNYTRLSIKTDIISRVCKGSMSSKVSEWQSEGCPLSMNTRSNMNDHQDELSSKIANSSGKSARNSCHNPVQYRVNNSNVFSFRLPLDLRFKIDRLFLNTIRQPFDECWSMSDIIWHVPKRDIRHFCTMICYTNEGEITSSAIRFGTDHREKLDSDQLSQEQYKIFILYIEFQGSLIPILRARKIGLLKPEFVVFDPEVDHNFMRKIPRHGRISDMSQTPGRYTGDLDGRVQQVSEVIQCEKLIGQGVSSYSKAVTSSTSATHGVKYQDNCFDLHESFNLHLTSNDSTAVGNFGDGMKNYLTYGRSHHQEPVPSLFLAGKTPDVNEANGEVFFFSDLEKSQESCARMSYDILRPAHKNYRACRTNPNRLPESLELARIKSNIWGTRFKIISVGNRMIKRPVVIGAVTYKASILHLQPRQIILKIKDMSNYCSLCSMHHHSTSPTLLASQQSTPTGNNILESTRTRSKHHKKEENKVVLGVGDILRIAPKLDKNQRYISAASSGEHVKSARLYESRAQSLKHRNHNLSESHSKQRSFQHIRGYNDSKNYTSGTGVSSHISSRLYGDPEMNRDDVLTFTMRQGDQVRVEMSASTSNEEDEIPKDGQLEEFLASNRALQSIRSITRRLEELSREADFDKSNQSTPMRSVEHSPATRAMPINQEANFLTPTTPVHRPRRSSLLSTRKPLARCIMDLEPSAWMSSGGRRMKSEERVPIDLPPPPPNAPLTRRISSTAKRFLDGSFKSLYSSNLFSSTETESEEAEVLVRRRRRRHGFPKQSVQSQPATPITHRFRHLTDLHSIGGNLMQKLRDDATKKAWSIMDSRPMTKKKRQDSQSPDKSDSFSRTMRDGSNFYDNSPQLSSDSSDSLSSFRAESKRLRARKAFKEERDFYQNIDRTMSEQHRRVKRSTNSERRYTSGNLNRCIAERKSICHRKDCRCSRELSLTNRPPVWNELNQVYQLDFGGRVTQESAKNLQIDHEGRLALQFGRLNRCTYTLDFSYPFNAVQAMSVALASLTQRLK